VNAIAEHRAGSTVDLLDAYAERVATLKISKAGRAARLRAAQRFLARHPDLAVWLRRPTPQRLADLHRAKAWPFVSWCFVSGHLRADLELLLAKPGGVDLPAAWVAGHQRDVRRVAEVGQRFGWSQNWIRQVAVLALPTVCLWADKTLEGLTDADFADALAELNHLPHVSASACSHARTRLFALQQACYELGLLSRPPRKAGPIAQGPAELAQAIRQPEIRQEVVRYVATIATTLRPASVYARTKAIMVLCDWLAERHPTVRRLDQLERTTHIEPFLVWARRRPWRGAYGRGRTVSLVLLHHDLVDLRVFFEDIACWGWASAPRGRLLFLSDLPRLPEPLPRALPPEIDRALMAAVAGLQDGLLAPACSCCAPPGCASASCWTLSWTAWSTSPATAAGCASRSASSAPSGWCRLMRTPSPCWTTGPPSGASSGRSPILATTSPPTSCSSSRAGG
jgi:hypothetical protein